MMREALSIILDCWKEGGPDDFDGTYWQVRKPVYNDRYYWHVYPYAEAESRIAFAGFMPNSGSMRVAGEKGYIPLSFHVAPEHVGVHWESVLAGAELSGKTPDRQQWRHARDIFVADTEEEARAAAIQGCMGQFWDGHFKTIAERTGILKLFCVENAPANCQGSAEDLINLGTWFVGTPDQVTDQIVHQYQVTGGFGTLLQLSYDYADPERREGWFRSMELLSGTVLPAVNARLGLA